MVSDIGILPDEHNRKIVRAGTIVGGIGGSVFLNQELHVAEHGNATLYTSLPGSDNDLIFIAKTAAATTIEYIKPAADTPISVAVVGNDIAVTLATNAAGDIVSTANDVMKVVNSSAANTVVEVRNIVTDSGEGLVTTMPKTELVAHNSVPAPEGVLFNDVDVTNGPSPCAMLYMGPVELSRIPKTPTDAQIDALKRITFMRTKP